MCGIAGLFNFGTFQTLKCMCDAITHRGPDDDGYFESGPVLLGNRRLSIVDLNHGKQPMTNEDGSVVVVYNGEIYNHNELRQELIEKGHTFRTRCDTEILPHLFEEEGIHFARRLNGIFAFALWDQKSETLYLVRDPIGVKPLLYAQQGDSWAFGSEAKAILASGLISPDYDPYSLHLTMNVRYIPGHRSLFQGIKRLPPGHVLEINAEGARLYPYTKIDWSPDKQLNKKDWIEGIRHHYQGAVKRQLMGDVPVGISLSGGIDSGSIVAMARSVSSAPLKTFSLGFNEPWDETADARFLAEKFETEHHELVLDEPVLKYLPDALHFTEEPKVNCLQLFMLHRFISKEVKVVLSGLGGDELFAGYDIFGYLQKLDPLRRVSSASFGNQIASPILDSIAGFGAFLDKPRFDLFVRGLEWLGSIHDRSRHYLLLRNAWDFNRQLFKRIYTADFGAQIRQRCRDVFDEHFVGHRSCAAEVLQTEFETKMVYDFLHNEDTMSLAHSVESRVPLLDLELVRFAARIPDQLRFGNGMKGLLKEALTGILPERTLTKKKWGFTFDPVEQFKKDLRDIAVEKLSPQRLKRRGIFKPEFVATILAEKPHRHLRWHYFMLWQMVGFEVWSELFID
jgi:asparagine synthase (glutamine-hydrolysing)